jgi:hypothetical protein
MMILQIVLFEFMIRNQSRAMLTARAMLAVVMRLALWIRKEPLFADRAREIVRAAKMLTEALGFDVFRAMLTEGAMHFAVMHLPLASCVE